MCASNTFVLFAVVNSRDQIQAVESLDLSFNFARILGLCFIDMHRLLYSLDC